MKRLAYVSIFTLMLLAGSAFAGENQLSTSYNTMYNEIYLDGNGGILSQSGPINMGYLYHYKDISYTVNALSDYFSVFFLDGDWAYPDTVEYYPGDGTYVLFIIYYDASRYVTAIYAIVENIILDFPVRFS